jgi:spore germination cell wall hydrolase CwlJ-like protein
VQVVPDDFWGPACIRAEARGEPFEGQVAVGEVVRRRTREKHFSHGTVVSTVAWPYQFSWMNANDRQRESALAVDSEDPTWRTAVDAWRESETSELVPGAVLYHADYVHPYWAKASGIEFVKRIGRHLFYRRKA